MNENPIQQIQYYTGRKIMFSKYLPLPTMINPKARKKQDKRKNKRVQAQLKLRRKRYIDIVDPKGKPEIIVTPEMIIVAESMKKAFLDLIEQETTKVLFGCNNPPKNQDYPVYPY